MLLIWQGLWLRFFFVFMLLSQRMPMEDLFGLPTPSLFHWQFSIFGRNPLSGKLEYIISNFISKTLIL